MINCFGSHFSEEEFIRSDIATRHSIDNNFQEQEYRENAIRLCKDFLEPIRQRLNSPIVITSGYRGPFLNKLVGGSKTSAHMTGRAVDFIVLNISLKDVFNKIILMMKSKEIPEFDQLIWEFGKWIHLGISVSPRKQVLQAEKQNERTIYFPI